MARGRKGAQFACLIIVIWQRLCCAGIINPRAVNSITIDTNSPQIVYSGDWTTSTRENWHGTHDSHAFATITFTGTSIAFRSTRSATHGVETAILDGREFKVDCTWPDRTVSGQDVVVWSQDGLAPVQHVLKILKTSPEDKQMVVWDLLYTPVLAPASASDQMVSLSTSPKLVPPTTISREPTELSSASSSIASIVTSTVSSIMIATPSSVQDTRVEPSAPVNSRLSTTHITSMTASQTSLQHSTEVRSTTASGQFNDTSISPSVCVHDSCSRSPSTDIIEAASVPSSSMPLQIASGSLMTVQATTISQVTMDSAIPSDPATSAGLDTQAQAAGDTFAAHPSAHTAVILAVIALVSGMLLLSALIWRLRRKRRMQSARPHSMDSCTTASVWNKEDQLRDMSGHTSQQFSGFDGKRPASCFANATLQPEESVHNASRLYYTALSAPLPVTETIGMDSANPSYHPSATRDSAEAFIYDHDRHHVSVISTTHTPSTVFHPTTASHIAASSVFDPYGYLEHYEACSGGETIRGSVRSTRTGDSVSYYRGSNAYF